MEKKLCKKCSNELSKDWNDKLCEEDREKRKSFIKKVLIGISIGAFGAAVAAVLASLMGSDDEGYDLDNDYAGGDDGSIEASATAKQHSLLPAKAFLWLYDHWGEDAAQEMLNKVQLGEMAVEQVEQAINRPDIDPEDWQDFEEGWHPSGW